MIYVSEERRAQLGIAGRQDNPFVTSYPAASTYSTGIGSEVQPSVYAQTESTYDAWIATPSAGQAALVVNFGTPQAVSMFAFAAHNLASVGASVTLERSTDGVSWTAETPTLAVASNDPVALRIKEAAFQYWRLNITGAAGNVQIATTWLGAELIIPQRIYQGFSPRITPQAIDLRSNVSEGNNYLATAYIIRGSALSVSFTHIGPSFIRSASWVQFQQKWNIGSPTFFAWRPNKYGDLYYAWRTQGARTMVPENSGPKDYMSFSMEGQILDA